MAPKKPSQHAADKAAEAKTAAMEARAAVNEKQFNPSQVAAKKKAEGQARILFFVGPHFFFLPNFAPPPEPPHTLVLDRFETISHQSVRASCNIWGRYMDVSTARDAAEEAMRVVPCVVESEEMALIFRPI